MYLLLCMAEKGLFIHSAVVISLILDPIGGGT